MTNEADVRARVAAWLREQGLEQQTNRMQLAVFARGWLVSFPPLEHQLELGGMRLVVDREDGTVHSLPANRSPEWTMRAYSLRRGQG
jgi:hypothetical protein